MTDGMTDGTMDGTMDGMWRADVERADVERAVSVMAARGEKTLVLCTDGRTEKAAMTLLPTLPEVCFVEVGDFTGAALRRAAEHGLTQVVVVGMAGLLTKLASGVLMTRYTRSTVSAELLGAITTDLGGSAELAAQVARATTARHAYELWETAGMLGRCGRELCRRAAEVVECFAAGDRPPAPGRGDLRTLGRGPIAAQVVLMDFTGEHMVAMYGRLAR
jgi:cobalt-precorrin-5B (C1)-methyltransferase